MKCANVDDIETASSSEHLSEEEDIVFQDCVDVYYTEEADDNSDDSNTDSFGLSPPSSELPPSNFEELRSLTGDDNNQLQGHIYIYIYI